MVVPGRSYRAYGLAIASPIALPCPEEGATDADVVFAEGPGVLFSRARLEAGLGPDESRWFQYAPLSRGASYLRWSELYEFVVSGDGRRIAWRSLNGGNPEAFQSYLLSQVLSFALVRQGIEPLHATTVVMGGRAVALLGDCGAGKSSLAAAFVQAGHRLLTDDLLVLREQEERFLAQPGPPRIKLFPEVARTLLDRHPGAVPMNPATRKLIIPLSADQTAHEPTHLDAIYVLRRPRHSGRESRPSIRRFTRRAAFIELTRAAFNLLVVESNRLQRQFELAARLAARIPVKSLSYSRDLRQISQVRESILQDLAV